MSTFKFKVLFRFFFVMLLCLERLVAVFGLLDDPFVEIGVDATFALMLGRVLDAAPVNLLVAGLFLDEDVAVVFQLNFALLTHDVFDF